MFLPFRNITFTVVFIILILSAYQTLRIDAPNYLLKKTRHESIINNDIEYPYKYRLLNPYITDLWIKISKIFLNERPAFLLGYFIQNLLIYGFMIFSVCLFFSIWFDDIGAQLSLLLFAFIVPLSLTGYDTLGDITTAGLMAISFYFINKDRVKLIYPITFLGAFNELQAILIPLFYFFASKNNFSNRKIWLHTSGMILTFISGYFLIYLIRGGDAATEDIRWYFTKDASFNLQHKEWIFLWAVMIGPFFPFVLRKLNEKPEFLRRSLIFILPTFYLVAFFFIGRMREIDKALTIFLILIPLAMISLFPRLVKNVSPERNEID